MQYKRKRTSFKSNSYSDNFKNLEKSMEDFQKRIDEYVDSCQKSEKEEKCLFTDSGKKIEVRGENIYIDGKLYKEDKERPFDYTSNDVLIFLILAISVITICFICCFFGVGQYFSQ